jgi:hypothetical protein
MPDFTNNLRAGDQVFDVELKLRGVVSIAREKERMTSVIFDGFVKAKRRDVNGLRFIPPNAVPKGKAEDVPPFDGELPLLPDIKRYYVPLDPPVKLVPVSPLETLEAKHAANNLRRETIQQEFVALGHENARIENAIAALKAV